jgi:hypothetical protein
MFLKEDVTGELYLYNKEKTEKIIDTKVLTVKDGMIELYGTIAEQLPSLDFIKLSDDNQYCLITFVRDDLKIVSGTTTKGQLKQYIKDTLGAHIPDISLANVEILGGVGEHYLDPEGNTYGEHNIFFVCPPESDKILIGDSKTPPGKYIRPRMILLQLVTPPEPSTSRKTFKISSRRFHKTKKLRL